VEGAGEDARSKSLNYDMPVGSYAVTRLPRLVRQGASNHRSVVTLIKRQVANISLDVAITSRSTLKPIMWTHSLLL